MEQKRLNIPKPPGKAFLLSFACILAAAGLITYLCFSRTSAARLAEYIDLGERYLEELNYEEAAVAFRKQWELIPGIKRLPQALPVLMRGRNSTNRRRRSIWT